MFAKKIITIFMFALMLVAPLVQAGGDPVRGAELNIECADCHGEDALGDDVYPRLAGQEEDHLFAQMKLIKKGELSMDAEMMAWAFEDLEEQDLADLAAYFASLPGE